MVTHISCLDFQQQGVLSWSRVAGPPEGTKKLSLFYFELQTGNSKAISFGNSEVVLYLLAGHALINIAGREFHVQEGCGVHIRSGEVFSLQNRSGCPFVLLQRFVQAAKIFNDRRICYTALMTISPNVSLMPGKTSSLPGMHRSGGYAAGW
jgi:mannose-6-phosphate isomerase-like protein (cupin superfamily)